MVSPIISVESVRIQDGGDLPKGLYFYALSIVDSEGNESLPHLIQVYGRYEGNIVSLFWEPDMRAREYRLYRGSSPEHFDGYFTVYDNEFHDNGLGVLNELSCQ